MEPEAVWELYQRGIEWKSASGLYQTVTRNERFYAGDQWAGVHAPDLPKPVVNFIKRACQQRVAEVRENPVRVCFEATALPPGGGAAATDEDAQLLNAVFESDWERMGMDCLTLDGLLDACVSGDCILYDYWDDSLPCGNGMQGGIRAELIDNVNYYPADPNLRDVQKQPHILLARREFASDVQAQAKAAGRPPDEVERIGEDGDTWYQSGDMARTEPGGKCVTLLRLWKDQKTGHVFAQKTARSSVIRPAWDTQLTRYPIAMMNWELRKNCCHGRAEITGLIPVQRYVNQMYAMTMPFTMQSACPKPLFNQGMIKAWSTAIGSAIPVNGDIQAAAKYLEPPALPGDAYSLPERLIEKTFEMLGVTQIELGNVNPTNMSAMTLSRKASGLTAESIRTRFYGMISDFARNWLDMTLSFETLPRPKRTNGKTVFFDAGKLKRKLWNVRIEVGQGELWSEIGSVQALNSLFGSGAISARQYIERLPEGYLPMRQKLLSELSGPAGELQNKQES